MKKTDFTAKVVERFREAVGTSSFVDITDAAMLYKVSSKTVNDAIVLIKTEGYRRFLVPYGEVGNVTFRSILSPPGTKFLDIYSNRADVVMLELKENN